METSDRGVLDVERFDVDPDLPIFHGLLGDMDSEKLAGLTTAEKSPFVLRLLGASEVVRARRGFDVRTRPDRHRLAATRERSHPRRRDHRRCSSSFRAVGRLAARVACALTLNRFLTASRRSIRRPRPKTSYANRRQKIRPRRVTDPIEFIVDAARRAPSGGNVQPWRFEADANEIRFYVAPERSASAMDVRLRGSYVAVGAALFNARVAAASIKRLGQVQLFPSGPKSDHVATLQLGSGLDASLAQLHPSVPTRAANRRMGRPTPIDASTINMFARGVEREGARLRLVTDRDRIDESAKILAESDRLRFLIPEVHEQMLAELRWPGRDSLEEGMDVRTLEMDPGSLGALELLGRPDVMEHLSEWRAGQNLGLRTQVMISSSSGLAVITVPKSDPTWYVRGGAAIERFWLSAELQGLAVQPVSPLFLYATNEEDLISLGGERHLDEMYRLSRRFSEAWDLEDGETMAMVMRVFHAAPPTVHSIRRPLNHVLSRTPDPTPLNATGKCIQNVTKVHIFHPKSPGFGYKIDFSAPGRVLLISYTRPI